MGAQKMRARSHPVQPVPRDQLEGQPGAAGAPMPPRPAFRGFTELETTVGVVRYAPLNALCLLVGSQTGRARRDHPVRRRGSPGTELGMRGLTAYAETVSVYGTEQVFVDGDDTPWSKAFLASAYASRGLKMRFTSGTGSEVQMGYAEGKSMLYLEIRCVMVAKGAGVQGLAERLDQLYRRSRRRALRYSRRSWRKTWPLC